MLLQRGGGISKIFMFVNNKLSLELLQIRQGCRKTWKNGNFLIKSGKTLKSQGKKVEKVRENSGNVFVLFVCFSGMHKIASSGQNFRYLTLSINMCNRNYALRRSGNFNEQLGKSQGNFFLDFLWQPCRACSGTGIV